jgi:hypothetical protein
VLQTLNGFGDLIVSVGRASPRLRDVLGEMLGASPEET